MFPGMSCQRRMATPEGLEPPTLRSEVCYYGKNTFRVSADFSLTYTNLQARRPCAMREEYVVL